MKPLEFLARGRRGLVQPALKTRGRDYLRIIHGHAEETATGSGKCSAAADMAAATSWEQACQLARLRRRRPRRGLPAPGRRRLETIRAYLRTL